MALPYERTFEGRSQTPIHEFVHPATESTISLVGMVHAALPSFYDHVSAYVQAREDQGSVVHIECSNFPDDATLETYPSWVRSLTTRLKAVSMSDELTTDAEYVVQTNTPHFQYRDHWKRRDINRAEIIWLLGRIRARHFVSTFEDTLGHNRLIHNLKVAALPLVTDGIVVRHRNKIALGGVEDDLSEKPDQSITLLWGSAHIPGIAKGILAKKYMHTNTVWYTDS